MALPPRPRKRFEGRFAAPARLSTRERLRRMTEEHEREERPFDPERRGTWRGKARELVLNPDQFHKDLEELVDGAKLAEPEEAFEKAKAILEEGGNPNHVMDELNELLEFHGVGAFPSQKLPRPDFLYLEAGDTYAATLVYSYDEHKYFVSTFGDIVENAEPEMENEEWDSWLESEVRKQLETEIENEDLGEEITEKILGALEDLSSEELHREFVDVVSDVGGQVTFESDGSVFVYRQEQAIDALAKALIEAATAVPEQTSFGFNPRRRRARRGRPVSNTQNYAIDTGDGNELTAGLQGYDYARKVAQRFADERGESVWLYPIPARKDDDGEYIDDSEEIEPAESE